MPEVPNVNTTAVGPASARPPAPLDDTVGCRDRLGQPGGFGLRWIHVSDLHFGDGGAGVHADRRIVTEKLIDDASRMVHQRGAPDLILVTGDIAFSGKAEQYEVAGEWLTKLVRAVGVDAASVRVVPGNHDVDRSLAAEPMRKQLHRDLRRTPDDLDGVLADDARRPDLLAKLEAYNSFAARWGSAATRDGVTYLEDREFAGRPVRVVGMCSVALSLDNKDGPNNLALGRVQQATMSLDAGDALLLVLQHHPPSWLRDGKPQIGLLGQHPHLLLTGHTHEPGGGALRPVVGHPLLTISAGAAHAKPEAGHTGPLMYSWGELGDGGLRYWPRRWAGDVMQMFVPDTASTPLDTTSACVIALPDLPDRTRKWIEAPRGSRRLTPAQAPCTVLNWEGISALGLLTTGGRLLTARRWLNDTKNAPIVRVSLLANGQPCTARRLWVGEEAHEVLVFESSVTGPWVVSDLRGAVAADGPCRVSDASGRGSVAAALHRRTDGRWYVVPDVPTTRFPLGAAVFLPDGLLGLVTSQNADGAASVALLYELSRDARFCLALGLPVSDDVQTRLDDTRRRVRSYLDDHPVVRDVLARHVSGDNADTTMLADEILLTPAGDVLRWLRVGSLKSADERARNDLLEFAQFILPWCFDHRDPTERAEQLHNGVYRARATSLSMAEVVMAGCDVRTPRFRLGTASVVMGRSAVNDVLPRGVDVRGERRVAGIKSAIARKHGVEEDRVASYVSSVRADYEAFAAEGLADHAEPSIYWVEIETEDGGPDEEAIKACRESLPALKIIILRAADALRARDDDIEFSLRAIMARTGPGSRPSGGSA